MRVKQSFRTALLLLKEEVQRLARLSKAKRATNDLRAADRGGLDPNSSRAVARALGVRLVGIRKRQCPLNQVASKNVLRRRVEELRAEAGR